MGKCRLSRNISIHAPRGGSDPESMPGESHVSDFNPRSPWGERQFPLQGKRKNWSFQSTLPVGGATMISGINVHRAVFQSTLPVGGATGHSVGYAIISMISIHAPRGGSDQTAQPLQTWQVHFNPRSPWGERPIVRASTVLSPEFQSTLPVGGATCIETETLPAFDISIHAPRGGSDGLRRRNQQRNPYFNPRSPWGERRNQRPGTSQTPPRFQSTLPVGGATAKMHSFTRVSLAKR